MDNFLTVGRRASTVLYLKCLSINKLHQSISHPLNPLLFLNLLDVDDVGGVERLAVARRLVVRLLQAVQATAYRSILRARAHTTTAAQSTQPREEQEDEQIFRIFFLAHAGDPF